VSDTRYIYTLRARHSDETLREADRNCLLLRAAAQGQLPRVQHLLRLGADVDFADDSGFTALHHAVSSGFEDCVQELIKEGADVNNVTSCGVALNIAADKGRDRVAEILLRARADCDEAIAFAEEKGLDFEVLEGFLTQAVRSSGVLRAHGQRIAVLATITTARRLIYRKQVAVWMPASLVTARAAQHQCLKRMKRLLIGMWTSTLTIHASQNLVLTRMEHLATEI
jgi:hypothetical protein